MGSVLVFENDYIPMSDKGEASGVATLDINSKVTASQACAKVKIPDEIFTLSSSDNNIFFLCQSHNVTCTIPDTITEDFECEFYRWQDNYTVTLIPGTNVNISGLTSGSIVIPEQHGAIALKSISTSGTTKYWIVLGDYEKVTS